MEWRNAAANQSRQRKRQSRPKWRVCIFRMEMDPHSSDRKQGSERQVMRRIYTSVRTRFSQLKIWRRRCHNQDQYQPVLGFNREQYQNQQFPNEQPG